MADLINPLLKETIVFRPDNIPIKGIMVTSSDYKHAGLGLLRYAAGEWMPDDGEPDLAFVHGATAYGVHIPHSTNILWSWRDIDLSKQYIPDYLRHHIPGWHYQTIDNTHWEDYRWDDERKNHPNEIAFQSAMRKCCSIGGCANGRGPEMATPNEWIKRGLVWVKSTMQPIVEPDNPICFLCLNNGRGHLLEALESKRSSLEGGIEYNREALAKAEQDIDNYTYDIEKDSEELKDITEQITQLEGDK